MLICATTILHIFVTGFQSIWMYWKFLICEDLGTFKCYGRGGKLARGQAAFFKI